LTRLTLEGDFHEALGIKVHSKLWNFLKTPAAGRYACLLHDAPTTSPTSEHTVAVAFASLHGSTLVLWHVGVRKAHPLNDSRGGRRWGVYGLTKDGNRWRSADGTRLTSRNKHLERYVFGSPNPYAMLVVCALAERFSPLAAIEQHPDMPCAQLFHPHYDHSTHPAIQLLYRALGFVRSPVGHYVWYASEQRALAESAFLCFSRMKRGLDGVPASR
jgi:hypothetical protein